MERKNKTTAAAKETGLARTTPSPFGWFGPGPTRRCESPSST